jgi:hypothetical protein
MFIGEWSKIGSVWFRSTSLSSHCLRLLAGHYNFLCSSFSLCNCSFVSTFFLSVFLSTAILSHISVLTFLVCLSVLLSTAWTVAFCTCPIFLTTRHPFQTAIGKGGTLREHLKWGGLAKARTFSGVGLDSFFFVCDRIDI